MRIKITETGEFIDETTEDIEAMLDLVEAGKAELVDDDDEPRDADVSDDSGEADSDE